MTRRDPKARRESRELAEETRAMTDESEPDLGKDEATGTDSAKAEEQETSESLASVGHRPEAVDAASTSDGEEPLVLRGEAWAHPLAQLEARWTWLETRLLAVALGALVVTLCIWFGIRGMKDPIETGSPAGTVWRALVGMCVLGGATRYASGKLGWDERQRSLATLAAVVVGALLAKTWRTLGIAYFGNLLDWLQQGSSIALFGGLKGISTRLTMLVSLIGASLACSTGTHINIDVVVRFIPKSWRKGAHMAGLFGAAVVCLVSSWGFFDFIAVSGFEAKPESSAGEKAEHVSHELGDHFFALRKQLGLDVSALPTVLGGGKWNADDRMDGKRWNAFLEESGFVERFGAEKVATLRAGADELSAPRRPFVVLPGESAAGVLIHAMDLLFPVGFLMIGLRMLLRILLVKSGQVSVEEEPEPEETPTRGDADASAEKEAA
jgi:TRAP-type C4-dicarboxylate transport system permease small subunit